MNEHGTSNSQSDSALAINCRRVGAVMQVVSLSQILGGTLLLALLPVWALTGGTGVNAWGVGAVAALGLGFGGLTAWVAAAFHSAPDAPQGIERAVGRLWWLFTAQAAVALAGLAALLVLFWLQGRFASIVGG